MPPTKQAPNFIKVHCINTDTEACAVCSRDFIVPITSVASFAKNNDEAFISFIPTIFCFDPAHPKLTRFMRTTIPWSNLENLLNGNMVDLGDITFSSLEIIT